MVRRAEFAGGFAYKVKLDGQRGFPDRFLVLDDFFALVETKRPVGGVLSEHQKRLISVLRTLGMRVYVPHTLRDVDAIFDDYIEATTTKGHKDHE